MNNIKYIFVFSLFLIALNGNSQESNKKVQHDHDHHNDYHKHNNEISFGIGITKFTAENNQGLSLHTHYLKGLGKNKRISLGLSFESIFGDHKHYTIGPIIHFSIYQGLVVSYSPGLLFVKEEEVFEKLFAQHIELKYEFEFHKFHLGPLLEAGFDKHGFHYMGGIHIGFDF